MYSKIVTGTGTLTEELLAFASAEIFYENINLFLGVPQLHASRFGYMSHHVSVRLVVNVTETEYTLYRYIFLEIQMTCCILP